MVSKTFIPMISAAALVAGKTPSGFTPVSNTDMIVVYGQTSALNGAVVDRAATANQPTLATTSKLNGTSYTVIMVDLDIPSNNNPHTFLHWMQTDLTPATAASAVTSSNGTVQAFTLTNTKNTAAIVNYTQPNPPAQNPLSHRYTEVLVDTSSLSAAALSTLTTAAQSRVGFDVNTVLQTAGLTSNVVAGNSFNVTNPGPATAAAAAATNANANANAAAAANATTTAGDGKGKKGKANGASANAAAAGNGTTTAGDGKGKGKGKGSANANAADNSTTTAGDGKGKGKGKGGANANAADNSTTTAGDGEGKGKKGKATASAAAAAAGLPAATGATVANSLPNSGAAAKNGTGTVTTSGTMGGYETMAYPVSTLIAGLLGMLVYAL